MPSMEIKIFLRGRGVLFDLKAHPWGRGQGVTVATAKWAQSALKRAQPTPLLAEVQVAPRSGNNPYCVPARVGK